MRQNVGFRVPPKTVFIDVKIDPNRPQIVKRDPKQTPARFSLLLFEITLSSLCDFPLLYLPAMPLSGSAKVACQRKYMRKVRQTQAGDSLRKRESFVASRR